MTEVFALRHWRTIATGIVVAGLLIALGITRHTLASRTDQLATAKLQRDAAVNAVKITAASLEQVSALLAAKNAESDARAKAFTDSKTEDAENNAAADARQKAEATRKAMLEGIAAHATANPSCEAPAALREQLRGL